MEVSDVRRQLTAAIDRARRVAQERRTRAAKAEKDYDVFLQETAVPVFRMLASALNAAGLPFTLATPGGAVRLASDKGRDDFIELGLDTSAEQPEVVARISRTRGSRLLTEEKPVIAGTGPDELSQEALLNFLLSALDPWLQR